jgi:hypothetical protein
MKTIAVTGPRQLTDDQAAYVSAELWPLLHGAELLVGCAAGVDELARELGDMAARCTIFEAAGESPKMPMAAKLQARSKRMVRALAAAGGTLVAFPNKPCPDGVTVASWQGSGTWGTVRYAESLGVVVVVVPLVRMELPEWLCQKQGALF